MRVVTWNTWWRFGSWRERQPLLLDAIVEQRPDVVLLQETWPEQAETVAAATDLSVIERFFGRFTPLGVDAETGDAPFGNAVLARPDRAEGAGTIALASPDDGAPRSGVAVQVAEGDARILFVATHLNHIATSSDVRVRQLETLRAWVGDIWPSGPVILGGDLNLTPYSPEYHGAVVPHWVDLWPHVRPDDPGPTMEPGNPRFRDIEWMAERNGPGTPPGVRFDYLLARRHEGGSPGVTVEAMEIIGGARHGWPSDHLGLLADLHPGAPTPG